MTSAVAEMTVERITGRGGSVTPDELAAAYQPLVHAEARKFDTILELEEAVGYGQLGLARAALTYQPNDRYAFATMARRQIRNAIVDAVRAKNGKTGRKMRPVTYMSMITMDALDRAMKDDSTEVEGNIIRIQVMQVLHSGVAQLDPEHRRAVQMYFVESYTFKAMGKELGLSEGMAAKLCREALSMLRVYLATHGYNSAAEAGA